MAIYIYGYYKATIWLYMAIIGYQIMPKPSQKHIKSLVYILSKCMQSLVQIRQNYLPMTPECPQNDHIFIKNIYKLTVSDALVVLKSCVSKNAKIWLYFRPIPTKLSEVRACLKFRLKNASKCEQIRKNTQICVKIRKNAQKCVKMRKNASKCAKMRKKCAKMRKNAQKCVKNAKFVHV